MPKRPTIHLKKKKKILSPCLKPKARQLSGICTLSFSAENHALPSNTNSDCSLSI